MTFQSILCSVKLYLFQTLDGPSAAIVLIDGGVDELLYICRSLDRTTKMPVVVVKGTGGIADVFCYALDNLNEELQYRRNADIFDQGLWALVCKTFEEVRNEEQSRIYKQVLSCLNMTTDLVSSFNYPYILKLIVSIFY